MKRILVVLVVMTAFSFGLHARQSMDFMLYNLGNPKYYSESEAMFKKMSLQFAAVMAPMFFGEADTRGSEGYEIGIGYTFTKINYSSDYWTRALNDKPTDVGVPSFYNGVDVHFSKGFSFGLKLYANVRYYILTDMVSGGFGGEYAINEGLKNWPDISAGVGYNGLFGAYDMNMHQIELRAKFSKPFVVKKELRLIPFFAYSHIFAFSYSNRLGGYFDLDKEPYNDDKGANYNGDTHWAKGEPFYFDTQFNNIDRVIIGMKLITGYFSWNIEGVLPINADKAFSFNSGFALVF